MSGIISKLIELLILFPGIGPRQARRFVYFLLSKDEQYINSLVSTIAKLRQGVKRCKDCQRYFSNNKGSICDLCSDPNRDDNTVMIVEKDIDLENVRRSSDYRGRYFVLGSLLPVLEKNPESRIRLGELKSLFNKLPDLSEIIIALSVNPSGDHTVDYLKESLQDISSKNIKITLLGRGLSTGTELEYSDRETLREALRNRR